MLLPRVISCGVFRTEQKLCQHISFIGIGLTICGLRSNRRFYPDGRRMPESAPPLFPNLHLSYPGFISDFEYGPDRENWVMMLEVPEMKYDPEKHQLYLDQAPEKIPLSLHLPLREEELPELRDLFARIARLSGGALASEHLKADLAAAGLLQRFLPQEPSAETPADLLRSALDHDRSHTRTIREHCRLLQENPDSLRRLFESRFGISPAAYREQLRRNDLLSLFTYSDASFKEIAGRLGLKHVQHLNRLTQQYFHCTPKELNRKYRKGILQIESSPVAGGIIGGSDRR